MERYQVGSGAVREAAETSKLLCWVEPYQESIMLSLHQRTPRKIVLEIPATRKTASESPHAVKGDQSHTSECDINSTERLTPRAQRHQIRELARQSKTEKRISRRQSI